MSNENISLCLSSRMMYKFIASINDAIYIQTSDNLRWQIMEVKSSMRIDSR